MRNSLPIRTIWGAMALLVSRLRSIRLRFSLAGFAAGFLTAAALFLLALSPDLSRNQILLAPAQAAAPDPGAAAASDPRQSICYIYGVYSVEDRYRGRRVRTEFSGTGFLVAPGLIATNGHIAEPWRDDHSPRSPARTGRKVSGTKPQLERLVAFFPGVAEPLELRAGRVSAEADVALLAFSDRARTAAISPLPLDHSAPVPGDSVTVVGYPLGLQGMLAKSPRAVSARLMREPDDLVVARELARLELIRPSSTVGHLGDVVEDTLVFDASTAHGGSGGPVLNREGKVIGITAAYLRGFPGGSLGVSVRALKPLLAD